MLVDESEIADGGVSMPVRWGRRGFVIQAESDSWLVTSTVLGCAITWLPHTSVGA